MDDDWLGEAPWLADPNADRPLPRCYCPHCQSEGRVDIAPACLHYNTSDED